MQICKCNYAKSLFQASSNVNSIELDVKEIKYLQQQQNNKYIRTDINGIKTNLVMCVYQQISMNAIQPYMVILLN
jgi:hypothetical protein